MFLETADGVAILGYAGLGATAYKTEPSEWMSAVLRSRNLPLEQSLEILAEAIKEQLPRHMDGMAPNAESAHNVMVPAFLHNEPRLYTIDLIFMPARKSYESRCTRQVVDKPAPTMPRTPRIRIAGSGARYLAKDKKWKRALLRVVTAHDCNRVSPYVVADHLAKLNNEVYLGTGDQSVGPRCIVAWRYRKEGGVQNGGGGHQFYTGKSRDLNSLALPSIGIGMDWQALANMMMPLILSKIANGKRGRSATLLGEWNKDELNAELARLPDEPDENLR